MFTYEISGAASVLNLVRDYVEFASILASSQKEEIELSSRFDSADRSILPCLRQDARTISED